MLRLYLRYPLSYEHVAELVGGRRMAVDAKCIGRWLQAHAPELNKCCRPYLKPVNTEETSVAGKGDTVGQALFIAWLFGLAA